MYLEYCRPTLSSAGILHILIVAIVMILPLNTTLAAGTLSTCKKLTVVKPHVMDVSAETYLFVVNRLMLIMSNAIHV